MSDTQRKVECQPYVVVVREEGSSLQFIDAADHIVANHVIAYRFIEDFPQDGFASWVAEQSENTLVVEVADYCREVSGSFAHQALNRVVAQTVIREKASCLVVEGLWGCTLDLPRIAELLNIPVIFVIDAQRGVSQQHSLPSEAIESLVSSLRRCAFVVADDFEAHRQVLEQLSEDKVLSQASLPEQLQALTATSAVEHRYSYSMYEFLQRDPPLLAAMQAPDVRHFNGCTDILDVACGAGIFLDCLRASGLNASGVERDPVIANYARGMGLSVVQEDALMFLGSTQTRYDGIYCSHFVEHLAMDALQNFVVLLHRVMKAGGTLVMVFPDPESIRSQLLGFWRDPEHVRFYHPELISSLAISAGFELEWSSYEEQPHEVAPFALEPAALPALSEFEPPRHAPQPTTLVDRLLSTLGVQSARKQRLAEAAWLAWAQDVKRAFSEQQAYMEQVAQRTDSLWAVNRTWAWNDNVTLRLRRR